MRILITGITGFVGGHLTEVLRAEGGHTLVGVSRSAEWGPVWADLDGAAELHAIDLLDAAALDRVIGTVKPEWVFHLAGYANPRKSIQEPDQCRRDNVDATRTLYESIARAGSRPRVLFASTGMVYGDPDRSGEPLTEEARLKPATPYAQSKVAAEELCVRFGREVGLDVVRVRLFNQIGPRQSTDYFSARFAKQIVEAERGDRAVIEVGDLTAYRDLTDVRDMVRAFRLLMDHGVSGEVYNAGRGQTWQIGDVLQSMLRIAGVRAEVKSSLPSGYQPETTVTVADTTKLRATTGWRPGYELDQTLADVMNYWRGVSPQG